MNRVAVVALAAVTVVAASGCSSSKSAGPAPSSAPAEINVQGMLNVTEPGGGAFVNTDGTLTVPTDGGLCTSTGGYSDLVEGASVVISDDAGTTLAIATLDPGTSTASGVCQFPFTTHVVAGKHFYGITVTHRGMVKFAETGMSAPVLTIGT